MRAFGRFLGRILLVLIVFGAALWWFGPYEPVDLSARFDPNRFGDGVQVYFDSTEGARSDITPGTQKRVIWAGAPETRTRLALVYIHGFSATSEEIRPVPDRIAAALGANLVYARLRGHGRGSDAMADPTVHDWMRDVAEALAAGRAVGERVIVLSTSTGGTLAAAAALDPQMSRDVAAMIFVSPNFGVNDPAAALLTWPGARYWLPLVVGARIDFEPKSEAQATFWTTSYPTVALLPMGALVKAVRGLDFARVTIPALFWFSLDDQVVRPDRTIDIAARWGGAATVRNVTMGPGDAANSHVIAGDIMSPGQTDGAVRGMLEWLAGQGIE